MNRVLLLSIFLLSLFSCIDRKSDLDPAEEIIQKWKQDYQINDFSFLFVVPNAGCDGCITSAEAFVVDNLSSIQNGRIIFTSFSSKKALKLKLGEDIYTHKKVFIDELNIFQSPSLQSFYPYILYMENDFIKSRQEVSPDSPQTLDSLLHFIYD